MKPLTKIVCYTLNLISYLLLGITILAILSTTYSPKYVMNLKFLQQDNKILIIHHQDYHTLKAQDTILYYKEGQLTQSEVSKIDIAKYQIHLQNNTYTTPSYYLGTNFYTISLPYPLDTINTLLVLFLSLPLSLLFLIIKTRLNNLSTSFHTN